MANLDLEVQSFVSKLSHIGDTRVFAVAFEELVRKFNCKFFVISGIAEERDVQQEMLVIHNLPELWVNEYLDNNYILNDPIARHCIDARNPFLWREAIEATASREAKEIMMRAEKHGLKNGVCFPIHDINGFEAGVSLSGFAELPKKPRFARFILRRLWRLMRFEGSDQTIL